MVYTYFSASISEAFNSYTLLVTSFVSWPYVFWLLFADTTDMTSPSFSPLPGFTSTDAQSIMFR